jgi:hypothetical protein
MARVPPLRETPDLPDELKEAALNGELVLFVGAGVSKLVGLPSWGELACSALNDLQEAGVLNFSELEQLKTLDPRKQLSIAKLIAVENSVPFDLAKHLRSSSGEEGIYRYLNEIGCACVTTNYDELLSPRFVPTDEGSTSPATAKRVVQTSEFHAAHLNSPGTVVHLHGAVSQPATMVATTKDYLEHYDNKQVQHFLAELFVKKVILFIGYGLEEAEVLEHILRRGGARDSQIRRRFVIQGFFRSEEPLYKNLHEYYRKSFGVHLIGFVRDYKNYDQLEAIAKTWSELLEVHPPAQAEDLDFMDEVLFDA